MLNMKNYFLPLGFCLLCNHAINAQEGTNSNPDTSNNYNFTPVNILPPPEASVTINQDPKIKMLLDIKSKMEKDGEFSDRYKIQLYYGNLNQANEIMKTAKQAFPQWDSSIQWETPNYKVWIGNYRSKIEADRALKEIKKEFPSAFRFIPEKK